MLDCRADDSCGSDESKTIVAKARRRPFFRVRYFLLFWSRYTGSLIRKTIAEGGKFKITNDDGTNFDLKFGLLLLSIRLLM